MEEDLLKILLNPFSSAGGFHPGGEAILSSKVSDYYLSSGEEVLSHKQFQEPVEDVLHPHLDMARYILSSIFTNHEEDRVQMDVIGERIEKNLEELQKQFKVFISTTNDETLEREARRLERRYFENLGDAYQIEFIKLKRFYEKIKTFNEHAKTIWRDVHRDLDALGLVGETKHIISRLNLERTRSVFVVIRRTDAFLDALRAYMKVDDESNDPVTGTFKIHLSFEKRVRYTLKGFFGDEFSTYAFMKEEDAAEKAAQEKESEGSASIARSIIIESRERRLNKASIISVPILGSRDWNRTIDYTLDLKVSDLESCLEEFRKAFHISLDETPIQISVSSARAHRGEGARHLENYQELVHNSLNEIAESIIAFDYPGLDSPEVFLYHCGPGVMLNTLLVMFRQKNVGEMFSIDLQNNIKREYPEPLIKKELILWWSGRFSDLDMEQVDSYLTFSRALEMVKKDYRVLYEEGSQLRKREIPGATYTGMDQWILDNRNRVFGYRKIEIFRRFIRGSILNRTEESDYLENLLSEVRG